MPTKFIALGIRREISEALAESGLTVPTPVQERAIPLLLDGKDVIAQAQTGTGKTLAFVLPILEKVDPKKPYVQALIVTPTRELALQITQELKWLVPLVGVQVLAAYGGQDVDQQIRRLQGGIHIVVATPGRLLDHLRRDTIQLTGVSMLVLDEADQMLQFGFLPDVEEIIRQTGHQRQMMLFSATIPGQVRILAEQYMVKPENISVAQNDRVTLDEIKQIVVETTDRAKQETLCTMITEMQPYLAMVFCRTKIRCKTLNAALRDRGFNSDELHGDLSQAKREQVMKRFKTARLQILVATDVAARGLDIEGITHVFNYDIPQDVESYIHRIGRTGRAGETGIAITFAAPRDRLELQNIEQGINSVIEKRTNEGYIIRDAGKRPSSTGTAGARAKRGQGGRGAAARTGDGGRASGAGGASRGSGATGRPGRPDASRSAGRGGQGRQDGGVGGTGEGRNDPRKQGRTGMSEDRARHSGAGEHAGRVRREGTDSAARGGRGAGARTGGGGRASGAGERRSGGGRGPGAGERTSSGGRGSGTSFSGSRGSASRGGKIGGKGRQGGGRGQR